MGDLRVSWEWRRSRCLPPHEASERPSASAGSFGKFMPPHRDAPPKPATWIECAQAQVERLCTCCSTAARKNPIPPVSLREAWLRELCPQVGCSNRHIVTRLPEEPWQAASTSGSSGPRASGPQCSRAGPDLVVHSERLRGTSWRAGGAQRHVTTIGSGPGARVPIAARLNPRAFRTGTGISSPNACAPFFVCRVVPVRARVHRPRPTLARGAGGSTTRRAWGPRIRAALPLDVKNGPPCRRARTICEEVRTCREFVRGPAGVRGDTGLGSANRSAALARHTNPLGDRGPTPDTSTNFHFRPHPGMVQERAADRRYHLHLLLDNATCPGFSVPQRDRPHLARTLGTRCFPGGPGLAGAGLFPAGQWFLGGSPRPDPPDQAIDALAALTSGTRGVLASLRDPPAIGAVACRG
jgi:hypothetical protein